MPIHDFPIKEGNELGDANPNKGERKPFDINRRLYANTQIDRMRARRVLVEGHIDGEPLTEEQRAGLSEIAFGGE